MKLNLLPTYVSKEGQIKAAVFASSAIALVSVLLAVGMIVKSRMDLDKAQERATAAAPLAAAAVAKSKEAGVIMASASGIQRNIDLADAMRQHNSVYTSLYRDVLSYTPSFFRVQSISASPIDDKSCVVTMTGVIRTFQQYGDLMLALLRIEGAKTVSRSGFQLNQPVVPALTQNDQTGNPAMPGQAPLPSDPWERFETLVAQGSQQEPQYQGVGNFGSGQPGFRGAMPNWSTVTVSVVLETVTGPNGQVIKQRNLRPPDPVETLSKPPANAPAPNPDNAPPNPGGPRPGGPGPVPSDEDER